MSRLRVLGIGNPDRGDDAVGPAAIAALAADPPPATELASVRGDMLALLDHWDDDDHVILVDALAPDGAPGRILRLVAQQAPVTAGLANFASSHAFNLAEAIELARALGRLPRALVVYGIEGAQFAPGSALSPAVAAALPGLVARLREECAACTKPR